jgi:hypothetical protein
VSEFLTTFAPLSGKVACCRGLSSGLRAVFRGANANNGGNAGVSTVNVNNAPSNANANIGVPLNN